MQRTDFLYEILKELYAGRPNRILFNDLKTRLPQFSVLPDNAWMEALRQISDDGLAEVAYIPSGFEGKWGAVVNAGITGLGAQEIEQIRELEYYGDQLFAEWSATAYEDLARVGADLREQFAYKGCLVSTSFWRAAVDVVFERFKGLEEVFIRSYLRPLGERTKEGLTDFREGWLHGRLEALMDRELRRARDNASRLCDVAGTSLSEYAAQINELDIRAQEVRNRVVRKIRIARIEQALPVVKQEPRGIQIGEPPVARAGASGSDALSETAPPLEVFYSYSHNDEKLRDQLDKHLSSLKREGTIRTWHDRRIVPGEELDKEIDAHLGTADLILLLVSPDFMASDYCYGKEVQRAMQRHDAGGARVIPIILRPVDWHSAPFGKLRALPTDGKPVTSWPDEDQAFLNVAQGIRDVASPLRKGKPAPEPEITLRVRDVFYTEEFNGVVAVVELSSRLGQSDQVTDWTLTLGAAGVVLQGAPGRSDLRVGAEWLPPPPFDVPGGKMTRGAVFFAGPPHWRTDRPQEPFCGKLTAHLFVSGALEQGVEVHSLSTLRGRSVARGVDPVPVPQAASVLEHAIGVGPELVIEYECDAKREPGQRSKPLTVRNLRGGTAYRVQVGDIVNGGLTAKFSLISHIPPCGFSEAAAIVESKEGISAVFQRDFVRVLEAGYQDRDLDELFTPAVIPVGVTYSDVNGKRLRTECEIEFHHFHKTARTTFKRRLVEPG